jgi:hypothetical protein
MKTINPEVLEAKMVTTIEKDLTTARRKNRAEGVLACLEEIVAVHMHTKNESLKQRCALLLGLEPQLMA